MLLFEPERHLCDEKIMIHFVDFKKLQFNWISSVSEELFKVAGSKENACHE